ARKAAEVRGAAHVLAKQHRLHVGGPHPHLEVTLHYHPRDNRVRDDDNPIPTLKACSAGLVHDAVVVDDAPTHMTAHVPVTRGPGEPRLWLVVAIPPQRLSDAAGASGRAHHPRTPRCGRQRRSWGSNPDTSAQRSGSPEASVPCEGWRG